MSLSRIAENIEALEPDHEIERRLRGWLSNLLTDYSGGRISRSTLRGRLQLLIDDFGTYGRHDHVALEAAFKVAMQSGGDGDHYSRPDPLADYLDCKAVTFQPHNPASDRRYWLDEPARGAVIAHRFADGACHGYVGASDRALWIAPYAGDLKRLCEEAMMPHISTADRSRLAARAVAKLGLCHFWEGDEILAFVSAKTIAELDFQMPRSSGWMHPVGPTAIEARTHARYRPWSPAPCDGFGRTYDLDPFVRRHSKPADHHGAPEATRPRLSIDDFETCIFIGELKERFRDDDEEYLAAIGASGASAGLLRTLADMTGL